VKGSFLDESSMSWEVNEEELIGYGWFQLPHTLALDFLRVHFSIAARKADIQAADIDRISSRIEGSF
jgi:hypothetical protein